MAEHDKAAVMEHVLSELANGRSIRSICADEGMPPRTTVRGWMAEEEFAAHSTRAKEHGFDELAEECIEIADDSELKADDKRIRIDTRIRLLGKWSQRYSDKHDFQHSGPGGRPIDLNINFV